MYRKAILAASAAAVLLGGCSRSGYPGTNEALLDSVRERIERLNAIYDTCMRVQDETFFTEWYMPDACSMPEGIPRACGRTAIAELRWNNGQSKVFRLVLHTEEVSGDAVQIVEVGNYLVTTTVGAALDRGKYIVVWRPDTDKRWKVHREIWNSDLPHDAPADTLSTSEG